jgi:phenylalanyl-tRNA synthetase beta chain
MKVTRNWLKEYVDFDWSPEELTERLTQLGLEVEGVRKLGGEFEGIVVAQVISREKHPNADKLSLCRVQDGRGERQIVCGAQNFKAGDKVPLILPGASLPLKPGEKEPFTIKVGKIRGVESHGMLCSPQELGLGDAVDGLLILREDAVVGQPFALYLGRPASEVVYDLEITPNRPDLNSVIGIAREISAITGNPLRLPELTVVGGAASTVGAAAGMSVDKFVAVDIRVPEWCGRYTARVVQGVRVGPSPDWLRSRLEQIGQRSINNVVDVTNYVMLECGQPLHAFDYHLLAAAENAVPRIVVRAAAEGEKFITLDGQERLLAADMMLIADERKGIALAGIMGGQNTEIQDTTRDVLIESAWFKPQNIRSTSKRLGLRSESSYRFERGSDLGAVDWASRRCAELILKVAGGGLVPGEVDVCPRPPAPNQVSLRFPRTDALLGVVIPPADQVRFLTRLGLVEDEAARSADGARFSVPTWRVDLKREADLIEEVARLYGVDRIPSTPPRGAIGTSTFDGVYDQHAEVRRLLTGLGLHEAQGQTLIAEEAGRWAVAGDELVVLSNPLSADMNALRPSLLPGLLDSLCHNVSRKGTDVALFEVGRVFVRAGGQVREERRLGIALTGLRHPAYWSGEDRDARVDLYDLKGCLEELLERFGMRGVTYARRPEPTALFMESGLVQLGGKLSLGQFGQLLPPLAKRYDLRDAVFLAELNLDQMVARRNPAHSFKALPQFPGIRRDLAMLVAEDVTHESVLQAVRQAKPQNLETVELFDVFRGQNVPAGQKSLAYAFTYRHSERTLTDAEVNVAHEKLVGQLRQALGATVREG